MTNPQSDAIEAMARAIAAKIYEEGEVYWALERGADIPALAQDRIAQAALAALEASGWAVVPVEATAEMVEAAKDARHRLSEGSPPGVVFNHAYRAMIAARPRVGG